MRFLTTVVRSVYSPEFYAAAVRGPVSSAIGYFLLLCIPVAVVLAGVRLIAFQAGASLALAEGEMAIRQLRDEFPVDLRLGIRGGRLESNVPEPFYIPLDDAEAGRQGLRNLLVIDTSTPVSLEAFRAHGAILWLHRDRLLALDPEGRQQIETVVELSDLPDFTFDQAMVTTLAEAALAFGRVFLFLAAGLIAVGTYLLLALRLVWMLVLALLVMLASRTTQAKLDYGASYAVGTYAMTGALLVDAAVGLTSRWTGFSGFPFMFTLITLGVAWVNLARIPAAVHPNSVPGLPASPA